MKKLSITLFCLTTALLFSCGDSSSANSTAPKQNPFAEEEKKKDVNDMNAVEQVDAVAEELTGNRAVKQYKKAEQKANDIKKLQEQQLKQIEGLEK